MYLDIAIGLLVGLAVSFFFGETSLLLIFFGAVAALAPDIDFLVYLSKRGWKVDQYAHEHRDLLHSPILFSGGGALLIGFFFPLYGLVWGLGSLWHFIHDTLDGGWGIRWLHPFYKGYFTLTSYSPKRHIPTKAEQHQIATAYGNPHWLKEDYFKPNTKLFLEWTLLTVVVVTLLVILIV